MLDCDWSSDVCSSDLTIIEPEQVRAIMTAALDVASQDTISPYTYHYLFGLLAATGLRISEALALQCNDLVEDGLIVRNGKFGKQRLITLQPSTRQALEAYLATRARLGATGNDLFVTIRGRAPHKVRAHVVFVRLARQLGYRGPTGTAGMRLHDLRHTFAVRSLESCPRDREAIAHHMATLSVYLGHASVANTYWYLEATPVLLRDIAVASEQLYRGEAA
jgi:integrase